jgi:uncharacterized membrane-anchored protein
MNLPSARIVEFYKSHVLRHGNPNVEYKDPTTKKLEDNMVWVPVKLLNQLLNEVKNLEDVKRSARIMYTEDQHEIVAVCPKAWQSLMKLEKL